MYPPRTNSPNGPNLETLRQYLAEAAKRAYIEKCQIFAELFKDHKEPVTKRLRNLVNNDQVALDLCQDTFLRLWDTYFAPHEHVPPEIVEGFGPLVYTTARHCAVDYIRKCKLHTFESLSDDEPDEFGTHHLPPQLGVAGHEDVVCELLCAKEALAALPDKERACLVLKIEWELTYQEIASELNMSVKAVSANISRAYKHMREARANMLNNNHKKEGSKRNGRGRPDFQSF